MRLEQKTPNPTTETPAFRQGAVALAPIAASVAPFGLAIGTAASAAQIPAMAGWLSAPLILAGTAQLTAIEMLDAGATPLAIVVSALVVNVRLLLYGAALAHAFRDESLGRRMLLAIPLIDQMYLAAATRFDHGDLDRHGRRAYWTGGATVLVGTWVVAHTIGMTVGASLPAAAGLDLAAPLALTALLAKSVDGRPATVAALAAAGVAIVGGGLPHQSTILVAAITGVIAGWTFDHRAVDAEASR